MKKLLRCIGSAISQLAIVLGILALTALTAILWGVFGLAAMAVTEVIIIVAGCTVAVIVACMPCLCWGTVWDTLKEKAEVKLKKMETTQEGGGSTGESEANA